MNDELTKRGKEIVELFNTKPKNGIELIKKISEQQNIEPTEQIALFFKAQKDNLNLDYVGDYLSGPEAENKGVLTEFCQKFNFREKSFLSSMREFLESFKLPGEAQKIDRLVEKFGEVFINQNPQQSINNKDAAYTLAFQAIMLNTDLHNPSIKNKMSFDALKRNIRGCNGGKDFDEEFLKSFYQEIKNSQFKLSSTKPSILLTPENLASSDIFRTFVKSTNIDDIKKILPIFQDRDISVSDSKSRSWLDQLIGYKKTVIIDDKANGQVAIQVSEPSLISRIFYNSKPSMVIEPINSENKNLMLAGQIVAACKVPIKDIKATHNYEREGLNQGLQSTANNSTQTNATSQQELSQLNTVVTAQTKELAEIKSLAKSTTTTEKAKED